MLATILIVIALVLAVVAFFIPPRAYQLLAVAVICLGVALLVPEIT